MADTTAPTNDNEIQIVGEVIHVGKPAGQQSVQEGAVQTAGAGVPARQPSRRGYRVERDAGAPVRRITRTVPGRSRLLGTRQTQPGPLRPPGRGRGRSGLTFRCFA
jgi:hypothetical protein